MLFKLHHRVLFRVEKYKKEKNTEHHRAKRQHRGTETKRIFSINVKSDGESAWQTGEGLLSTCQELLGRRFSHL